MQDATSLSAAFDALIKQGLEASKQNDSDTALRLFGEASQMQPRSGVPHLLSAAEYAQMGNMGEAEVAFANAVLLAPELHIARFQLGLLQFSSGRAAIALVTWQPLLALPQDDCLGWFVQGFAALAQDRFDEALERFEKGTTLNKANPPLNGDIAKVMAEIRKLQAKNAQAGAASQGDAGEISGESNFFLGIYRQGNQLH